MSNLPYGIVAFYVFVLGLCVGSFLNVAILRGLSGEDIVFGRSKCPKCNNKLAWYMNIPLVSYLFLKGKCAFCKEHISFQYPLVEFITGISFLGCFLTYGLTLKTLFMCIILSLFIMLFVTDIKETVIIDYHAYILAVTAFLYSILKYSQISLFQSVLGAFFGFFFFEVLSFVSKKVIGQRMFGEGDSLIAVGLGALFGVKNLLIVIGLSFLIQCIGAIPLLIVKSFRENKKTLACSYIIVAFSLIFVFFLNYLKIVKNEFLYLTYVVFIVVLLIWSLKNIVSEINMKKDKLNNENNINDIESSPFCLLPFGPSLIIASVLCLFFISEIKSFILKTFL